jgi:hypothetical protein
MKGKVKKLKETNAQDSNSSSKKVKGLSTNVLEAQAKSQATVKTKAKIARKNGSGKKIGDSEISHAVKISTPVKDEGKISTKSPSGKAPKSPKVDGAKKSQNLKNKKVKNAPSSQKDLKGKRRGRKDIQIVIETPTKKGESKVQPSRSQSKTKQRMQSLSKVKEEDEFLQTVRGGVNSSNTVSAISPKSKTSSQVVKPKKVAVRGGRKETTKDKDLIKEEDQASSSRKNSLNKSESKSAVKRERSRDFSQKNQADIKLAKKSAKNIRPAKKKSVKDEVKEEASQQNEKEIKKPQTPKKGSTVNITNINKEKVDKKSTSALKKQSQKSLKSQKSQKQSLPIRTPTKKFKKSKTPTPESELEEQEISEEEQKPLITNSNKKIIKNKPLEKKKSVKKGKVAQNTSNINLSQIKIKEQPDEEEKSESSDKASSSSISVKKKSTAVDTSKIVKKPIRHQLAYKVDTQGISEEIAKILRNIDEKKKREDSRGKKEPSSTNKRVVTKKLSAKDYNFKLQRNPSVKVEHIVKISDLSEKENLTHTDVLLAILELASNSEFYNISYANASRFFWEDVIKYDELKPIFQNYQGETLRKYWRILSMIGDVNKIADLVKRYKKFLDSMNIKLLSIISCIQGYFTGKIADFEESVKKIQIEVKKTEQYEVEEIDGETGEVKKIKIKKQTTRLRNKYLEKECETKKFAGNNFSGNVEEVFGK